MTAQTRVFSYCAKNRDDENTATRRVSSIRTQNGDVLCEFKTLKKMVWGHLNCGHRSRVYNRLRAFDPLFSHEEEEQTDETLTQSVMFNTVGTKHFYGVMYGDNMTTMITIQAARKMLDPSLRAFSSLEHGECVRKHLDIIQEREVSLGNDVPRPQKKPQARNVQDMLPAQPVQSVQPVQPPLPLLSLVPLQAAQPVQHVPFTTVIPTGMSKSEECQRFFDTPSKHKRDIRADEPDNGMVPLFYETAGFDDYDQVRSYIVANGPARGTVLFAYRTAAKLIYPHVTGGWLGKHICSRAKNSKLPYEKYMSNFNTQILGQGPLARKFFEEQCASDTISKQYVYNLNTNCEVMTAEGWEQLIEKNGFTKSHLPTTPEHITAKQIYEAIMKRRVCTWKSYAEHVGTNGHQCVSDPRIVQQSASRIMKRPYVPRARTSESKKPRQEEAGQDLLARNANPSALGGNEENWTNLFDPSALDGLDGLDGQEEAGQDLPDSPPAGSTMQPTHHSWNDVFTMNLPTSHKMGAAGAVDMGAAGAAGADDMAAAGAAGAAVPTAPACQDGFDAGESGDILGDFNLEEDLMRFDSMPRGDDAGQWTFERDDGADQW